MIKLFFSLIFLSIVYFLYFLVVDISIFLNSIFVSSQVAKMSSLFEKRRTRIQENENKWGIKLLSKSFFPSNLSIFSMLHIIFNKVQKKFQLEKTFYIKVNQKIKIEPTSHFYLCFLLNFSFLP
jgi:hypothetical protein